MLVRCPQCRSKFRVLDFGPTEHVIQYLCPGCRGIVRLDLELDEVPSSSSAGHYRGIARRRKVLVADDSREVVETATELLTEAGLRVLVAGDGEEALRIIRAEHPDLIVLDLLLPAKTGFEVLREMRLDERVRNTPVLATSRVYKESVVGFLQNLGARGLLDKDQLRSSLVFRVLSLLTPPPLPA